MTVLPGIKSPQNDAIVDCRYPQEFGSVGTRKVLGDLVAFGYKLKGSFGPRNRGFTPPQIDYNSLCDPNAFNEVAEAIKRS
jgi:hypothetical protein